METYELIGDQLSRVENRYTLAIIAARRVRLLNLGAERRVEVKSNKLTTVALMEALAGKVDFRQGPDHREARRRKKENSHPA